MKSGRREPLLKCTGTNIKTNEQLNMKPSKETNKAPVSIHTEMEINELSEKEFRIVLSKKFIEPQK